MDEPSPLRQVGLVVHPTRPIEGPLEEIDAWASAHGLKIGQVTAPGQSRRVRDPVEPAACDLLVGLGGDGTALSALHAGAPRSCPVLAVACGSIGELTSVSGERLAWALEQIATGRWTSMAVPALDVAWGEAHGEVAINDIALVRDGPGQLIASITIDGVLYARIAGDGVVVATALGSTAYTMAAGGPILAPGTEGVAVTPLEPHGGFCPPVVVGNASDLTLTIEPGYGGVRCELDGHLTAIEGNVLTVRRRPDYATLVELAEEEPRLTGLRRRGLVLDSPRVLARENRSRSEAEPSG